MKRMILVLGVGLLLCTLVLIFQPEFSPVPPKMTPEELLDSMEKGRQDLAKKLGGPVGLLHIDYEYYPDWGFTLRFYHPGLRHKSNQLALLLEIIALFTVAGIWREYMRCQKANPG